MKFVKAFNALGYEVPNPRQAWSAESEAGVCITVWTKEAVWAPFPRMNLWEVSEPGKNDWEHKYGHKERSRHLQRAMAEFDGSIDVVVISGVPGGSYGDADPWQPAKRKGHKSRIERFDEETGYFDAAPAQFLQGQT